VTTPSQLHPQRSESVPHIKTDGEAAASTGRGEPEKTVENQARARRLEGAIGHDRDAAMSAEPPEPDWEIDPVLADRFASEFRPSWAPLSGAADAEIPAVPRLTIPPPAGASVRPERIPREMRTTRSVTSTREEAVTVPGRRMKRRAAALTVLSIASFVALTYWGVSSATKPGFQTEISSATRSAEPPHAAQPVTTPDPQLAAAAAAPAPTKPSELVADRPTPTPIAADETQAPSAAAEASAAAAEAQPVPEAAVAAAAAEPTPATTAASAEPNKPSAPEKVAAATPPAAAPPAAAAPAAAAPNAATAAAQPAAKPATTALAVTATAAKAASPTAPHESAAHAVAAPPLAAAVVKKPEPPPQPQAPFRVRNPLLVVRALPEGVVRLWLDGQRMANPFDVRLPRDSKHKIEARAEGYETSSQTVRIEADAKLTFALRRVAPPAPAHAAATPATPAHAATNPALENGAKTADKRRHGAGFVTTNPY
jgi:hypothetical protein